MRADLVSEVLEKTDIAVCLSRRISLQHDGPDLRGACPFHEGRSDTFRVSTQMQSFSCSACGARGTAIDFLQRYLGWGQRQAVWELAREAGIDVEWKERGIAENPQRQYHEAACRLAADWFRSCLRDTDVGLSGREYLRERGITEATQEDFGLGWAPETDGLANALAREHLQGAGVEVGLLDAVTGTSIFAVDLMVPIRSQVACPIGFIGRHLGTQRRKYFLARESAIYRETHAAFGIDRARAEIERTGVAVLVEGPFDCMWLHQVGFTNTVALYPFSLSAGRIKQLVEAGAREVVFMFDGDEGGRNGIRLSAINVLRHRLQARVSLLPDNDDPDTFAMREGRAGIEKLLESAVPYRDRLLEVIAPEGREATDEVLAAIMSRLWRIVPYLPPGEIRSEFIAAVATRLGRPTSEMEKSLCLDPRDSANAFRSLPSVVLAPGSVI